MGVNNRSQNDININVCIVQCPVNSMLNMKWNIDVFYFSVSNPKKNPQQLYEMYFEMFLY